MCGRFSLALSQFVNLINRYGIQEEIPDFYPRYNIAPNQTVWTIMEKNKKRILQSMIWGLKPKWTQNKSSQLSLINARAESVIEKKFYQPLLKYQRCVVPSDGFFEWMTTNGKKRPYRVVPKDIDFFSFAALWTKHTQDEKKTFTMSIITTQSNSLLKPIHDRMSVILTNESKKIWLNEDIDDLIKLRNCLKPYRSDLIRYYEVSSQVNSWKHDSKECIKPIK